MSTRCGRCRSGKRWFWFAAVVDYSYPRCEDPVCEPGLHPHEYGWGETEDLAVEAMAGAVARFGGEAEMHTDGRAPGFAGTASDALKRINEARRRARPPSGETGARVAEYLYEAHVHWPEEGPPIRKVVPWQIARKTAKRIYFTDGGYLSRDELETDTRCPGPDYAAGGYRCEHGSYNRHGYPPGEVMKGGRSWSKVGHLFATREAAEADLYGPERERERQRQEQEPELRRLRKEMADAHPDRGGTDKGFIAARERYEQALRKAS